MAKLVGNVRVTTVYLGVWFNFNLGIIVTMIVNTSRNELILMISYILSDENFFAQPSWFYMMYLILTCCSLVSELLFLDELFAIK